jgi:hypothetical protein
LTTVDHPTAREWEAKLDKLMARTGDDAHPKPTTKSRWDRMKIRVLAAGVLFLVVVFVLMAIDNNRKAANVQAINGAAADEKYQRDMQSCIIKYNDNNAAYQQCMKDRGH